MHDSVMHSSWARILVLSARTDLSMRSFSMKPGTDWRSVSAISSLTVDAVTPGEAFNNKLPLWYFLKVPNMRIDRVIDSLIMYSLKCHRKKLHWSNANRIVFAQIILAFINDCPAIHI